MSCEKKIKVETKAEKKVHFVWADFYSIDDFGKDLFAEALTLTVSRARRTGGFVDNKRIPDACESLSY